MTGESTTPRQSPEFRPGGELREYADGAVVVVNKVEHTTYGLGELRDYFNMNPVAQDSGAALIQVDEGTGKPRDYWLDAEYVVDGTTGQVADLRRPEANDPSRDVTIGQSWHSPWGHTGRVHAVVMPYVHGYMDADQRGPDVISPSKQGRDAIDAAVGRPVFKESEI